MNSYINIGYYKLRMIIFVVVFVVLKYNGSINFSIHNNNNNNNTKQQQQLLLLLIVVVVVSLYQ